MRKPCEPWSHEITEPTTATTTTTPTSTATMTSITTTTTPITTITTTLRALVDSTSSFNRKILLKINKIYSNI